MNSKVALVTGGAGFIGSNLVQELLNRRYRVIILDNLSTGSMENIELLSGSENVKFVHASITDLPLLSKLFKGVDYVFHLAAIPSAIRSIKNPLMSNNVNITGTLNVLVAAKDNKVKKVIYASSSSIYGDTPTLPKKETMLPMPQSPYAVTKLAAECYFQVFQQVHDLETCCLRYFNVYGPNQDPNSHYAAVIPLFIARILQGKQPIIFGDGEQTRDFTFIQDAVDATILAAESDATGVLNVGSGNRVTITELARLVSKIIGKDVEPVYQRIRPGDIRHSLADISKAREKGYNPKYTLRRGLEKTVKWLANRTKTET